MKIKRWVAALLCVLLIGSLFPTSAFAADIASGTGWNLSDDGVLHITGAISESGFNLTSEQKQQVKSVVAESGASISSGYSLFYEFRSMVSANLSELNTSSVTSMIYMFYDCSSLTSLDLSSFDTSSVDDMSSMFARCSSLTSLDVSGFKTDSLMSADDMFLDCSSLTSLGIRPDILYKNADGIIAIRSQWQKKGSTDTYSTADELKAVTDTVTLLAMYTVNVQNDGNGTASANPAAALKGDTVTLTATPNNGYHFKEWQSSDVTVSSNNTFTMPEKDVTVTAVFEPIGYDLWVGGVQVTEANKGNVLGDSGTPTVTYDPATGTLTLNDYDGSYIKANCPLNIVLADGTTNAISVPSNTDENGIYANGGCTISGSGSLTVEVYNSQWDAIHTIGDLTISGAVDLRVDRSNNYGICTKGDVSVSGNCSLTFLTASSSINISGDLSISGSIVADIHSSRHCISCYSVSVDLSDSGSMTLKSELGGDGITAHQNDVVIGGSGEVTINADGRGIYSNGGSVIFSGNGVITVTSVSDAVAINDPTGEKALLLNGTAAPITLIAGDSHMAVAGYPNKTSPVGGASLLTYYDDITGAPNESKVIYDHVPSYGVSFEMNGHGDQITAQTVRKGDKATKPADPTASGWTFGGWYADETLSARFDFDTAITANTTIYAKWTENTTPPAPTYTIIAGADGEWTKGSTTGLSFTSDAPFAKFDSVKVDESTIAAANYTAEEGSTKITLAPAYLETLSIGSHSIRIVSKDGSASTNFTVKAAAQPPVPAKYTVSFNMNGHGTQIADQTVEDGSKAAKPADPKASGYTFGGWYADATFSAKFDFNTAITANTTVYAKWTKNSAAPADPTSPQTGDTSNMFLWIALLLVSGGALVGTTVYSRKKKYNAK